MSGKLHHRLQERKKLQEEFERGASVLMLAPRRIGKTWLMGEVAKDMADRWLCISIDLQGNDSEDQFLRKLCQKIEGAQGLKERALAQLTQRFRQASAGFKDGNLADVVGSLNHRDFLEVLISSLNEAGRPTIILIDELALFFLELSKKDPDQAKSLLYHLRGLMHAFKNVRWFFTGSVGLDAVARRHGIEGALLGVDLFPLEPFTPEEAESFVGEIFDRVVSLKRFSFEPGAFERLVEEIGWLSPYHIEQVVRLVRPEGNPASASVQNINVALDAILKPGQRLHFAPWAEHIDKNFEPADAVRMKALLDVLCENTDGEVEVTLMTRLQQATGQTPSRREIKNALLSLEGDAYLTRNDGRWKFRSGLLRRYWMEYCQQ